MWRRFREGKHTNIVLHGKQAVGYSNPKLYKARHQIIKHLVELCGFYSQTSRHNQPTRKKQPRPQYSPI